MNNTEGTPIRSATQDANAGIVDPPIMRHATREIRQTDVRDNTGLNTGLSNIGVSLGMALQSRLKESNNNIRERQANEAAIRQGSETAINSVDAEKKRSGWQEGVFGQSVSYRQAQQRAATNAVNAAYLEQATSIDQFAGESPEAYKQRLNAQLDQVLEPYGNDAETKGIVAAAWNTASSKLANKHYESHYAYNQIQQRETYDAQVAQTFDTWTVEASLASNVEEQGRLVQDAQKFFNGNTKPTSMSDTAWRDSVNSNLNTALRKGNIGAYNAAKSVGWVSKLNEVERVKLDQALSAYDTDFTQRAQLVYEEAELAALDAVSLDDAVTIYTKARENIDMLATRLSGTDRGNLALARVQQSAQKGKLSAQEAIRKADEQAKKIAMTAAEKALEAQAAEERHNNLKWSTRIEDPRERAGFVNELDPKTAEMNAAMDDSIVDDVTRLSGAQEKLSMTDATKGLLSNVKIASVVAARYNTQTATSPMLKTAVESFVAGFSGMANEDGLLNEDGKVVLQAIAQFEKNPAKFKNSVDKAVYDDLQIVKLGLSRGKTVEMVQEELRRFNDNKGKADIQGRDWGLDKNQTKSDKIRELVEGWTGTAPRGDTLTNYMEEFSNALQMYGNNTQMARDYLRRSVDAAAVTYKGIKVDEGNYLNTVTDYNFETLMDGVQKYKAGGTSLFSGVLSELNGAKRTTAGTLITNISQIPNVEMYTDPAYGGFFITSPTAQQPVYVSEEEMKDWAETLEERDNFQKLRDKKERGTILSKWGAQEMTAPLSNLN